METTKLFRCAVDQADGGPTYLQIAGSATAARKLVRTRSNREGWRAGTIDVVDVTSDARAWDRVRRENGHT